MHTALLLLTGVALLAATFAAWRPHRGWQRTPWGWGALWTLWFTEAGLGLWLAWTVSVPTTAPIPADQMRPYLPEVGGRSVPADLAAGPDEAPTVLFVGDSFTAGQGVSHPDTLPSQVGALLRDAGTGVRVLNHGREGRSLFDMMVTHSVFGARAEADVVVWVHVLNDLGRKSSPGGNDFIEDRSPGSGTGLLLWDVVQTTWANRELEAATEASYRHAVLGDAPQVPAAEALLTDAVAAAKARGARFIYVIYPLLHELDAYPFAEVHTRLRALGEAAGAEVVDLLPAFEGADETALWVSTLDHHPNAQGHARAARRVADALRSAPIPTAGPADCTRVPAPGPYIDATRAACAGPPAAWLDLADLALATPGTRPWTPMNQRELAHDLAIVAAFLDPAVHDRAVAILGRARSSEP